VGPATASKGIFTYPAIIRNSSLRARAEGCRQRALSRKSSASGDCDAATLKRMKLKRTLILLYNAWESYEATEARRARLAEIRLGCAVRRSSLHRRRVDKDHNVAAYISTRHGVRYNPDGLRTVRSHFKHLWFHQLMALGTQSPGN